MSLAALETSSLLPSGVAHPSTCRLPWYSTFGRDKFPISQEDSIVHEMIIDWLLRYSTFGWDKLPISQEDSIFHETTIDRLLRYSTFGWDKLPISQEDLHVYETITIDYYGTRPSQEELLIQKMEIKEEIRSLHPHKTVNQEKFLQKEPTNSLTKKLYLHAKRRYSTSY